VSKTAPHTSGNGQQRARSSSIRDAMTTSLPDLSPLVGRRDELDHLSRILLDEHKRLITLTGIGGTGKTRLAMELCRKVADKFADGFAFVRLSEVGDVSMVPSVIAQQLRVQEIVGRPIKETLLESLAQRHMLLVLDNFEQIMPAATFLGEVIAATEKISFVVTSRQRQRCVCFQSTSSSKSSSSGFRFSRAELSTCPHGSERSALPSIGAMT